MIQPNDKKELPLIPKGNPLSKQELWALAVVSPKDIDYAMMTANDELQPYLKAVVK